MHAKLPEYFAFSRDIRMNLLWYESTCQSAMEPGICHQFLAQDGDGIVTLFLYQPWKIVYPSLCKEKIINAKTQEYPGHGMDIMSEWTPGTLYI